MCQVVLVRRFSAVEAETWQNLGALLLHGSQVVGIETQRRQDRRRDLSGFDWARHRRGRHRRVGHQHDYVEVVMREAAVLGEFLGASRIGDADVRLDDDVGRARVAFFAATPAG